MRTYVCDWCRKSKVTEAGWILGFAAEWASRTGVQREITIAPAWSEKRAEHPLAVHFCSEEHKHDYIAALFRKPTSRNVSPERGVKQNAPLGNAARKHCSENSTALGTVSIETTYRTEPLSRAVQKAAKRRKSKTATKSVPVQITTADQIRSHGLSIQLDDKVARSRDASSDADCWMGS
jgi:hypothetical protein